MEQRRRARPRLVKSLRGLRQRGLADPDLEPETSIAALGFRAGRFAEMWLAQRRSAARRRPTWSGTISAPPT